MTTSVGNNSVFRSFFEKQKLTGANFIDWYRQLHLVFSIEDKENYLEHPIPVAHVAPPGQQVPPAALAAHAAWTPLRPKKDNPAKDAIYHQCGEVGHWRRNCPVYLAELMKKKKLSQRASTLGIFTIELYSFPSKSWIYDTDCSTHICITTQGLQGSKKLKPGALSLYVGDGHRIAVEAIGT
nr:zinc finger, CCHC-type [Tanacetum cinerariifolium]